MKAIVCNEFGSLDKLQYIDVDAPTAAPGNVVLDIKAAGVNYPDGLMVQGLYQMKPAFPFTPGSEVAGVVNEIGEGVSNVKKGDRVIGFIGLGGYAEQGSCPATHLIPIPDGISDPEAAGLTTAHATAHYALKQRANIQAGETLLVTGAAGGTGLAAVQIGKAMGATVIAACSTEEKLQMAKEHGADILINYVDKDLKTELKAINGGKGIDVVYDAVGGDIFDACSRCMAWNGRLLVIGFASGRIPQLPVNLTLVKGYSVVGVFWGAFTAHQPKDFAVNMKELLTWYLQGKVKVVVDDALPLAQAKDALDKVMNRQVKGKMVLIP